MVATLQSANRRPWILPFWACANSADELLVRNAIAQACYFANGQHHTLKISTREHPEIRSAEQHEAQGGHIDFGNPPEPLPIAASGLQ
jgi:hypothetical protein